MDVVLVTGLVVALLVTLLPRRPVRGRTVQLFGVLFPSWRFFEEVEPGPVLFYRAAASAGALGEWTRVLPAPRRSFASLFLNPQGNLVLACHALGEQLIAEILESDVRELRRAAELVSYRLVQRVVVYMLPPELRTARELALQWKLTWPATTTEPGEDVLVSEVFSRTGPP